MLNSLQLRRTPLLFAAALLAALATLVAVHAASGAPAAANVKVAKTALGPVLADSRGRTLYMFAADKGKTSVCYGKCAAFWPPLLGSAKHVAVGAGVKSSLLGTTKRKDGALQITYAGHPLYLFVKDTKAGQTTGQGLNVVGGLWWVVSPSGAVLKKKVGATSATTTTPAATTTTPGYGYGNGYR
jgi:predicted lipoprotein with Yx(FWY)xxD motif